MSDKPTKEQWSDWQSKRFSTSRRIGSGQGALLDQLFLENSTKGRTIKISKYVTFTRAPRKRR